MKKLPWEQRKLSTTVAMSQSALGRLDVLCEKMKLSRSAIVEMAVLYFYRFQMIEPDPAGVLEKQKPSSVYGEVHDASKI